MPDDRSIARSAVKDVVRRDQHSGSRHVLDDSGGFTWNVLGEVARNKPGVSIIASTRGATDDELDCFALVELLDRGTERRRDQRYRDKDREYKHAECLGHETPPCNLAVLADAKLSVKSCQALQRKWACSKAYEPEAARINRPGRDCRVRLLQPMLFKPFDVSTILETSKFPVSIFTATSRTT